MKKLLMLLKLFFIFLLFYLSITAGNFWESDSQAVYQTAKNLVDKGSFVIDCKWEAAEYQGKCYSKYGLFISLIVAPFYSAGKIFSEVFYFIPLPPQFFPSLTNSFIIALLVVLIYQYLIKLNFSKKHALGGSALFGFATYLPAYTKTLFSEPLLTLLTYSAVYVLIFWQRTTTNLLIGGMMLGLAFLTKLGVIIFAPALLYLAFAFGYSVRQIVITLLPVGLSLTLFFVYNYLRLGNPLDSGYRDYLNHPLLAGLYINIFSPGKSLFLYQPIILFSFLGLKKFYQQQKFIFKLFIFMVIINFLFFAVYQSPTGDLTWGTRYLYPSLPVFIFSLMYFIKYNRQKILTKIFFLIVGLSIIIQISSVYINFHRYYAYLNQKLGNGYANKAQREIIYSPLFGQWKLIFHLGFQPQEEVYWREAFQDYPGFILDYRLAPPDIILMRSKIGIVLWCLFIFLEWRLIKKLL